jgi:hypothetical protein
LQDVFIGNRRLRQDFAKYLERDVAETDYQSLKAILLASADTDSPDIARLPAGQ